MLSQMNFIEADQHLCYFCNDDMVTLRNMREYSIPNLLKLGDDESLRAVETFNARFSVQPCSL